MQHRRPILILSSYTYIGPPTGLLPRISNNHHACIYLPNACYTSRPSHFPDFIILIIIGEKSTNSDVRHHAMFYIFLLLPLS
jgi:hypothetical protein